MADISAHAPTEAPSRPSHLPSDPFLRSLTLKAIRDQRRALVFWALGVVFVVALYLSFYPAFHSRPDALGAASDALGPDMSRAFGLSGDLSSGAGFLNMTVFNILLPWLFIAFGVTTGMAAIAGAEDRGLLEILLSLPVTRRRLVRDRAVALVITTAFLGVVATVAIGVIGRLVGAIVPFGHLVGAVVSVCLLGLTFGTIALALGAATGRPAIALGGSLWLAGLSYGANTVGIAVPSLGWVRRLSPHDAALGSTPIVNGASWPGLTVLVGISIVMVVIATLSLDRRDIGG